MTDEQANYRIKVDLNDWEVELKEISPRVVWRLHNNEGGYIDIKTNVLELSCKISNRFKEALEKGVRRTDE